MWTDGLGQKDDQQIQFRCLGLSERKLGMRVKQYEKEYNDKEKSFWEGKEEGLRKESVAVLQVISAVTPTTLFVGIYGPRCQ